MRSKILISICLLIFLIPLIFAAKSLSANPCPISSSTNIVFYGETGFGGVGIPSRSWIIHFLDWWKAQDSSINYAELDSSDVKADCNLASFSNLKLYIQPGGDAYKQQNKLNSAGRTNILNLINSGKAFFGTCAGFYYAANDYYWQDQYYNHPNMLDIYPTVEGSIREIADYDKSPGYALTTLSNGRNAIYYGGPTRGYEYTSSDFPGIADSTFSAIPGNLPAIIKYNNLLLSSVHLEAYENDGISGLSIEDRIENYKYLANLLNQVAGTNFYVPSYTNPECDDGIDNDGDDLIDLLDAGCDSPNDDDETNCGDSVCDAGAGESWQTCSLDCAAPQCSDGIDNDNDSLIDFPADLGCSSASDNDETDIIGPATIFFDDFESGGLSGWITTAVSGGNIWTATSTNPYQGTKHAQSQPMSTTEPASILERTISTSGYSNIKLSYYRKLVGLDIADEFKAKWFDGITWSILEQTGSSSVNDASYVFKEFSLPASSNNNVNFKIRFECTSGAVSEFCRIDNVKLLAQ